MSRKHGRPPKIAERILRSVTKAQEKYSIVGDYEEEFFEIADVEGLKKARRWYWCQMFSSLVPCILNKVYWNVVMFLNYLKIIYRNASRSKGYSLINITGLAVGMACCILILLYITTELSYDNYHENADRIYRMITEFNIGEDSGPLAVSNNPAGPTICRDFPDVEEYVRFRRFGYRTLVRNGEKYFFENNIFFADESVFEIFTFPMFRGDAQNALAQPYTMVITEATALKYFGNEDPIGKQLDLENGVMFTVMGIIKDVPHNSHFTFDMLCSFATVEAFQTDQMERWVGQLQNYTYFLLKEGADYQIVEEGFSALVDRHLGALLQAVGGSINYHLQPLSDIHFNAEVKGNISSTADIDYLYIFAAIAIFILVIACINFMNLSTARSTHRSREVGMRKVLGSQRIQLIKLFFGESILYSSISAIFAIGLVLLLLPVFNELSGMHISIQSLNTPGLIVGVLGIIILVGFCAGSYPAFVLSSFQPVRVLRGEFKKGKAAKRFRNVMVIFQFTISITLLIGTIIILDHIHFMKSRKLGFDKAHVVVLPILDHALIESVDVIKSELTKYNDITQVAVSSHVPGHGARYNYFLPEGYEMDQSFMMGGISADHDFLSTMKIELVSGRSFSPQFPFDVQRSVLLNESAVRRIGWDNPIGKTIEELDDDQITKTVIGVVKDFHVHSLHAPIPPLVIDSNSSRFGYFSIRLRSGTIPETMDYLEKKWMELDPTRTFDYSFLDQAFDSQYRTEERISTLFLYFTGLAIFVACLGLFGLASFTAERRQKEISVRKILGSSVFKLVGLLSKETMRWVLFANIIAWPIAWYGMRLWLQQFAYRTEIRLWVFFASGIIALMISFITVSYQSIKTAITNPAHNLRNE